MARLTKKQREVLWLVSQGYQRQDIAEILQTSPYTVDTYYKHIRATLNCKTLAQAVSMAHRMGMLTNMGTLFI